jgi:hypothetical protein
VIIIAEPITTTTVAAPELPSDELVIFPNLPSDELVIFPDLPETAPTVFSGACSCTYVAGVRPALVVARARNPVSSEARRKGPRLVAELHAQFAESAKREQAIKANLRGLGYGE